MNKTDRVDKIVGEFGAAAKAKLNQGGQPEDQLRNPIEILFAALANMVTNTNTVTDEYGDMSENLEIVLTVPPSHSLMHQFKCGLWQRGYRAPSPEFSETRAGLNRPATQTVRGVGRWPQKSSIS